MGAKKYCIVLLCLLLCGCGRVQRDAASVMVGIVPAQGCMIPANGQRIAPGQDAAFELVLEEGYSFAGTDYTGKYAFEIENGKQMLHLYDVRYPTRVHLWLTDSYRTVTYDPNGGQGAPVSRTYDVSVHTRPNTSIGTELYRRPGYTLVGWNTAPDGSGTAVGLGSRVTVPPLETVTLYAQWLPWTADTAFSWEEEQGSAVITGFAGTEEILTVPERLGNCPVRKIKTGAFTGCTARWIVLPQTLEQVEDGAFTACSLEKLTFYDNLPLGDGAFRDCRALKTISINAKLPPYGFAYRRESCLADKMDFLILSQGTRKLVCFGGCSMWYNLDGRFAQDTFRQQYRVINMGLNGVVNAALQMELITAWLEPGDVFFHTPELSSQTQLMLVTDMTEQDDKLWCGLEYNYDLLTAVDARHYPGLLDAFCRWKNLKSGVADYLEQYKDSDGRTFLDELGGIPFPREHPMASLADGVWLEPGLLRQDAMDYLDGLYQKIRGRGAAVYVSYACVNIDAVPEAQKQNVDRMDSLFRDYIGQMQGVTLVSRLRDYLYHNEDFYDTNYHLLSQAAWRNTGLWLEDLCAQMERDGIYVP